MAHEVEININKCINLEPCPLSSYFNLYNIKSFKGHLRSFWVVDFLTNFFLDASKSFWFET